MDMEAFEAHVSEISASPSISTFVDYSF